MDTTLVVFSGIIFDFNGVLLWDNMLHEEAWRAFSSRVRGFPLTDLELAEHVHGRNNAYSLQYLADASLSPTQLATMGDEKEAIYRRLCLQLGAAYRLSPGAESLLDFLVEKQIPRTIATASGRDNVNFFIDRLNLERWFDLELIVYDDGTLAGKPAPDFYLAAAQKLGLLPAQCVVIEDSLSGMRAAQAAGIGRVLALLGDAGHARRGELPRDIEIINTLDEVDRSMFERTTPRNLP